jgi:hypothetical protein
MTDDDVIDAARADGFRLRLTRRAGADHGVWGFVRGDDDRSPVYLERRHAIDWIADRLHRAEVFR